MFQTQGIVGIWCVPLIPDACGSYLPSWRPLWRSRPQTAWGRRPPAPPRKDQWSWRMCRALKAVGWEIDPATAGRRPEGPRTELLLCGLHTVRKEEGWCTVEPYSDMECVTYNFSISSTTSDGLIHNVSWFIRVILFFVQRKWTMSNKCALNKVLNLSLCMFI